MKWIPNPKPYQFTQGNEDSRGEPEIYLGPWKFRGYELDCETLNWGAFKSTPRVPFFLVYEPDLLICTHSRPPPSRSHPRRTPSNTIDWKEFPGFINKRDIDWAADAALQLSSRHSSILNEWTVWLVGGGCAVWPRIVGKPRSRTLMFFIHRTLSLSPHLCIWWSCCWCHIFRSFNHSFYHSAREQFRPLEMIMRVCMVYKRPLYMV